MIQFSKYKYISILLSVILIATGFFYTYSVNGGYAHSLDFNGGLRAVIQFDPEIKRESIETIFKANSIDAVIVQLNKDKNTYQIDIGLDGLEKFQKLIKKTEIQEKNNTYIDDLYLLLSANLKLERKQILSGDQVGAVVGKELFETAIILLFSTLAIIVLYLSFRFQFKFALAASLALVHDMLFTLALIGAFQIKPSVPLIAALLTILGYSINDTIVVFDRIRENVAGKLEDTFSTIIDRSINQTLGRTINTSFATLISLVAIIVGGATELFDFAYVLIAGIVVGTYSSIFIAAPVIEIYDKFKRR